MHGVRPSKFIWTPVYSSTHWLLDPATPPSRRIWAHIRGRYWSAKIDEISLLRFAPKRGIYLLKKTDDIC
jgi:hypothetical protein